MTNSEQEHILKVERARLAEKLSENGEKGKPRGVSDTAWQDDYDDEGGK